MKAVLQSGTGRTLQSQLAQNQVYGVKHKEGLNKVHQNTASTQKPEMDKSVQ